MDSRAKAGFQLGGIWYPDSIIISDTVKRLLESSGIDGLRCGEVAIVGNPSDLSSDPFWELQSSISLPKMPFAKLIHPAHYPEHPDVEPFKGDYSRTIMIDDKPFFGAEVHYHRSEIEVLGRFDIAATFENYMGPHPSLVVSQRF